LYEDNFLAVSSDLTFLLASRKRSAQAKGYWVIALSRALDGASGWFRPFRLIPEANANPSAESLAQPVQQELLVIWASFSSPITPGSKKGPKVLEGSSSSLSRFVINRTNSACRASYSLPFPITGFTFLPSLCVGPFQQ
jgi:hypothetical protein